MKSGNKKDSLRKAGYAPSTYAAPTLFFDKPKVREEIERRQKRMIDNSEVTEDTIIRKLAQIAFTDLGEGLKITEEGDVDWDLERLRTIPALRGILNDIRIERYMEGRGEGATPVKKVHFKSKDQLKALELLMKFFGMLTDKVEFKGEMSLVERLKRGRDRVKRDVECDTEETS